jgi:hypothetical protein
VANHGPRAEVDPGIPGFVPDFDVWPTGVGAVREDEEGGDKRGLLGHRHVSQERRSLSISVSPAIKTVGMETTSSVTFCIDHPKKP